MLRARLLVAALVGTTIFIPTSASASSDGRLGNAVDGFAAVAGNGLETTAGGAAGRAVTVSTLDDLKTYAIAAEPLVIRVRGTIEVAPFGDMIPVGSDNVGAAYSDKNWKGWPSVDDPYAGQQPTQPYALQIILKLTPANS